MLKFNFPGDIHFLTFRTFQSHPYFKDEKCCELFLENLEFYRSKYPLLIYGYAILYNHLHLLLSYDVEKFPELTISKIVHGIKGRSAQLISKFLLSFEGNRSFYASAGLWGGQGMKALSTRDCMKIWQSGFYDYNIYSPEKFNQKLKYIHKNPVKHNVTADIAQYRFCSWRNYELGVHSTFKIDYLI